MKLSCSAYQAGSCSYAQKILSGHTHVQNYGATSSTANPTGESTHGLTMPSWKVEEIEGKGSPNDNSESINEGSSSFSGGQKAEEASRHTSISSHSDGPPAHSDSTGKTHDSSRSPSQSPANRIGLENRSRSKSVGEQQWTNLRAVLAWYGRLRRIKRSKSNQRWMKLRTTVQLSGAITSTVQKKATLKREDSFLKRFSTRQVPEAQETFEIGEDDGSGGGGGSQSKYRRKKKRSLPRSVVNPDGNFYFYWLFLLTVCVLYNLWTLIVRESFPELQSDYYAFWITADAFTDLVIFLDLAVQFRTGYLEQGLMVYKTRKLAKHYAGSKHFWFDVLSLLPTDLLQLYLGTHPMCRIPRFLKTYRMYNYYYMVESRTVYPNVWRVMNLIHILLLLAHWFGCFYYLISEAEDFKGPWVYPDPDNFTEYAPLVRKYLGSLYWSTLTLTTIGDLPTPESNCQYLFTIVSYLIGVFIFATIVGQVGNVITNRNANRLEFERLLDGAKMYMRHHRVPRDMQRRVLRWYDYSWSRGRIQGGGDINTALGLLPDKLKTELALHVNLSVLKKVTIFQECQPEFLHDLVLKMKAYIFTPGDLICRKGEVAREMFIIADGILEVISETGRVLTTMQAGDFFGEIGILNLDGLNKRTADVRSVGYSELFSLSREDVLAAMKDYPEAQDILQTLGRKRLMEARKANAPVKKTEKKSPLTLLGQSMAKGPDDGSGEPTAGKRIVEKLRSDVKGLRNAIRKSRKSNSSKEDSSEPESGKDKVDSGSRRKESTVSMLQYPGSASIVGSMIPASAAGRGVLKRMHNVVLSDEMEKVGIGGDTSMSNLSPTILPKRVQMQLPFGEDFSGGSRPRSESNTSGDREVIGAGLPLIQRLRLLKQKEDKERVVQAQSLQQRKPDEEKPVLLSKTSNGKDFGAMPPQIPPIPEKSAFHTTKVSVEPAPTQDKKRTRLGSSESGQGQSLLVSTTPPIQSSFRPKPGPRESGGTSTESSTSQPGEPCEVTGEVEKQSGGVPSRESRPSALRFQKKDPKNYGSVDDLSPEFSRLPFIKRLQILNERQKIAELLTTKTSTLGLLTRSTSEGSSEIPHTLPPDPDSLYSVTLGRRTQSSTEPCGQGHGPQTQETPLFPLPLPSPSSSSSSSPETKPPTPAMVRDPPSLPGGLEDEPIRIRAVAGQAGAICLSTGEGGGASGGGEVEMSPQASPPYSPECNETPERRHLKSILKTLAKSQKEMATTDPTIRIREPTLFFDLDAEVEEAQLLKEPTLAGYAARHRKFAKNVTFQRQAVTVVSPNEGELYPGTETEPKQKRTEGYDKELAEPEQLHRIPLPLELVLGMKKEMEESGNFPVGLPPVSTTQLGHLAVAAQEECIGSVFLGIKTIIQSRMEEFQLRFQDRFSSLEKEVRQRDEIIALLQHRIQELEEKGVLLGLGTPGPVTHLPAQGRRILPGSHLRTVGNGTRLSLLENHHDADSYDEDEEDETDDGGGGTVERKVHRRRPFQPQQSSFLFSRGDSIDTVIDNTEAFDDDEVFMEAEDDSRRATVALQASQVNAQWTVAERESIEMTEFGSTPIPLWQLEFHREASGRPLTLDISPSAAVKTDTVTVDIGNTSTEYESTSSSEEEQKKDKSWAAVPEAASSSRVVKEVPIAHDSEKSEDDEEDDDDGNLMLEESTDSEEFDNQNWEVQMLAKEMSKREEELDIGKRPPESAELADLVVGEMLELDSEIQEMRDVVNSGTLSPTELDMLESMLESRTERVQALFKAYSVDDAGRRVPASSSTTTLATASSGRSICDFRPRTSVQYTHFPFSGFQRRGSSRSNSAEKRPRGPDYHADGSRRKANVRRQSSLCETRFPAKLNTASSYLTRRRESAGSLGPKPVGQALGTAPVVSSSVPTGKSFLSRFNFMRSLSRTFLYRADVGSSSSGGQGVSGSGSGEEAMLEQMTSQRLPNIDSESPPYSVSSPIPIPVSTATTASESSFSTKRSQPLLPSSIKSDPGPSSQHSGSASISESPIFTIPTSSSSPLDDPVLSRTKETQQQQHHTNRPSMTGESQPLLKK